MADINDLDSYLRHLQAVRRLSRNTLESYARDLHALDEFARERKTDLRHLDRQALEAWVRGLMSEGRAPSSVARSIAAARGLYKFLVMDGRITVDPGAELRAIHRSRARAL